MMTERYNALGKEEPVFTELRNVMDMRCCCSYSQSQSTAGRRTQITPPAGTTATISTEAWHTLAKLVPRPALSKHREA